MFSVSVGANLLLGLLALTECIWIRPGYVSSCCPLCYPFTSFPDRGSKILIFLMYFCGLMSSKKKKTRDEAVLVSFLIEQKSLKEVIQNIFTFIFYHQHILVSIHFPELQLVECKGALLWSTFQVVFPQRILLPSSKGNHYSRWWRGGGGVLLSLSFAIATKHTLTLVV